MKEEPVLLNSELLDSVVGGFYGDIDIKLEPGQTFCPHLQKRRHSHTELKGRGLLSLLRDAVFRECSSLIMNQ